MTIAQLISGRIVKGKITDGERGEMPTVSWAGLTLPCRPLFPSEVLVIEKGKHPDAKLGE